MQIHELNNFTGTLGSGAYLAIDDGTDTGKISSQGLLAATEARIDNIIAGPAPSAEEIVDARLGADGVTYPSLGDAIRDQFTDVKADIIHNDKNGRQTLLPYSAFERGGLNNGADVAANYRVRSHSIITADRDWTLIIPTGWRIGVQYFVGGVYSSDSGWIEAGTYDIKSGKSFRIVIRKKPEDSSSTADVSEFVNAITFDTYLKTRIDESDKNISFNTITIDEFLANGDQKFQSADFARGGLSSGVFSALDYRVATPNIISFTRNITIDVASGYRFGVHLFEDGEFTNDTGWLTTSYIIPKDQEFKIVIRKNTEDTSALANISEFVNALTIETYISTTVPTLVNEVIGSGNLEYVGDKIVVADDTSVRKCQSTLWKSFLGADIADIADYSFTKHQSMAIFGGYVFLFSSDGICTIVDFATKDIVSSCQFTPNTRQHANSAQFTNVYYDDNDEFPLLLLSRCGNSVTVVRPADDACLVYRITRSDTTFTMTLINSIEPTFDTYGGSWGVDNNTKALYYETYLNNTYQVSTGNALKFRMFDMPSKASLISGTPISLGEADVVAQMLYDFNALQGMTVNGGIIYSGITASGQNLWAIDIAKNRVTSKIKLTSTKEIEGVAVYGGKIYLSQKDGHDTENVNPLDIFELAF